MIQLSSLEVGQRWDVTPEVLREAIFSDNLTETISLACEKEGIPEDHVKIVAARVGFVLLGFLRPEELAQELRDVLKIDPKVAMSVAGDISRQVFAPLRNDIDKMYQPADTKPASEAPIGADPKMLEEVAPVVPVGTTPMKSKVMPMVAPAPAMQFPALHTEPSPEQKPKEAVFPETVWGKGDAVVKIAAPAAHNIPAVSVSGAMPRPQIVGNLQKTEMGKIPLPRPDFVPRPSMGALGTSFQPGAGPAPAAMPGFGRMDAATAPLAKAPYIETKAGNRFESLAAPTAPPPRPAVIEFGVRPLPPANPAREDASHKEPPAPPQPPKPASF